jgi:hypothetical protein
MNRLFAVAITVGLALQAQAAFSFSGSVGDEVLPIEPVGPVTSYLQCDVVNGVIDLTLCQSVLTCDPAATVLPLGSSLGRVNGKFCFPYKTINGKGADQLGLLNPDPSHGVRTDAIWEVSCTDEYGDEIYETFDGSEEGAKKSARE